MLRRNLFAMTTVACFILGCGSTKQTVLQPANDNQPQVAQTTKNNFAEPLQTSQSAMQVNVPAGAVRFELHEAITTFRLQQYKNNTLVSVDLIQGSEGTYIMPGQYRAVFEASILVGEGVIDFKIEPNQPLHFIHLDVSPDREHVIYWSSTLAGSAEGYQQEKLIQLCMNEMQGSTVQKGIFPAYAEQACDSVEAPKPPEVSLALARIYLNDMTGKYSSTQIETLLKSALTLKDSRPFYLLMEQYREGGDSKKMAALVKQHENSTDPAILMLVGAYYAEFDESKELGKKFLLKSAARGHTYPSLILADLELRKLKPDYVTAQAWLQVHQYLNESESADVGQIALMIRGKINEKQQEAVEQKTQALLASIEPSQQASVCFVGMQHQPDFAGKPISYLVNSQSKKQPISVNKPLHLTHLSQEMSELKVMFYTPTDEIVWIENYPMKQAESPHMCIVWPENQSIEPQRYSNSNPGDCSCVK